MARLFLPLVLAVLLGATVYEMLVGLRVIELGSLPGEGPPGAGAVGVLAAIALLGAALVSAILAAACTPTPAPAALLAPAAGAFLLARFYAFDPYYLPTLIRYSERDFVPPVVVFVLAALSLAAGLVTLWRPRLGLSLSVASIIACAPTAWFVAVGH